MTLQEQHYYQTPGHVIAAGIVLSLVPIIAVAVRFTTRTKGKQSLKADDWLLLTATVCAARHTYDSLGYHNANNYVT